jgi:hypothetical protein
MSGCRQRAYTELYVENMASEVRMLEDRVYEYDAAYQSLERDVEEWKRKYEKLESEHRNQLHSSPAPREPHNNSSRKSDSLLRPSDSIPTEPPPITLKPSTPAEKPSVMIPQSSPEEVMEAPPAVQRAPVSPPVTKPKDDLLPPAFETLPPSLPPAGLPEMKPGTESTPQASQSARAKTRNTSFPSPDSLVEQVTTPEGIFRTPQQSKLMTAPQPSTNAELPIPPTPSQLGPTNTNNPAGLPTLLKALPNLRDNNSQGSLMRSKIRLPEGSKVQWASANEPVQNQTTNPAVDEKILNIAFHPTLCRGHNFDEKPGDDGLYLVMTPVNESGQVINAIGTLTIVVEDAGLQSNNGRVAAWEFEPEQLKELLEPIGASQGFHLRLPWQDTQPTSPTVTIFVRYILEDQRILVNKKEIRLRKPTAGQSTWTPRS